MPTRWAGEPRNHGDINHINGCASTLGCRCGGYRNLNPDPPGYLKHEEFTPNVEAEEGTD